MICTRNRPEILRSCLASISNSLRLPGETLVIDQSADELTRHVVEEFAENPAFNLRYFHHDGVGHTSARNIGVKLSRGDIIAYTDDDCRVDELWTTKIMEEFERSCPDCVCGRTIPANHSERPRLALLSTLNLHARKLVRNRCNPLLVGRGNNMAFRRLDLVEMGGFNEKIGVGTSVYAGDDADVLYRLVRAGGTIVMAPDVVVWHCQPDTWRMVVQKKRGYAISFAAIFSIRALQGDAYAAMLLCGKILYEGLYLFLGGMLTMRGRMMQIGWHSLAGTISGMKHVFNRELKSEIRNLGANSQSSLDMPADTVPAEYRSIT